MDNNPKIHFHRGVAYKDGKDVTSIDAPSCNCGFDTCDCAIIMTDLGTGDKYALYFLDGALSFSTKADFDAFKESDDTDDLNATVIAEV
jgi:hypothetical protein